MNNIHQKFVFLKNLGVGASSTVKLSKNIKTNKLYAIKKVSKIENLDSILNEIKIMKSLDHVNILKFNYLYECSKNFYLVLEYCNFLTLKKFIKKNKLLDNKQKLNLVNQILEGLNYLNSKNLVHRDLKPNNIFLHKTLNDEIIVKIGDFGLSNYLNEEFIHKRCGTPGFIAPEILKFANDSKYEIDSKVDVYAFGHLFYYIFTNSYLYEYEDINDLIFKNWNNLYSIKKDFNQSLKKIVRNCLIEDPKLRINILNLKKSIAKFDN